MLFVNYTKNHSMDTDKSKGDNKFEGYPVNQNKATEETGVNPPHTKDSDIGAGRQIGDPLSGTLSDRAGDEGFDDDDQVLPFKSNHTTSESDDDL